MTHRSFYRALKDPEVREAFEAILKTHRDEAANRLIEAKAPVDIWRGQGAVKALDRLAQFVKEGITAFGGKDDDEDAK